MWTVKIRHNQPLLLTTVVGVFVLASLSAMMRSSSLSQFLGAATVSSSSRNRSSNSQHTKRQRESTSLTLVDVEEFLDLLPWETTSLLTLQNETTSLEVADNGCNPPDGISRQCCIGDHTRPRTVCSGKTLQDYQRLKSIALQHTVPLPPARHDNNNSDNGSHSRDEDNNDRTNPCDICRIANLLLRHNLTISFVGDSITRQSVSAFMCELQRRNYTVESSLFGFDSYSLSFRIHDRRDDTATTVNGSFYNHYTFPKDTAFWDEQLPQTDVLVVNYGLHWVLGTHRVSFQPDTFRVKLRKCLAYWSNFTSFPRLVVFRESSAQHFDSNGGEYWLRRNKSDACVPLQHQHWNESENLGWREELVRRVVQNQGYKLLTANESLSSQPDYGRREIILAPFLHYTAKLEFMHANPTVGDCTHYCYSPYLWWPFWRSLRMAMDRRFDTLLPLANNNDSDGNL